MGSQLSGIQSLQPRKIVFNTFDGFISIFRANIRILPDINYTLVCFTCVLLTAKYVSITIGFILTVTRSTAAYPELEAHQYLQTTLCNTSLQDN